MREIALAEASSVFAGKKKATKSPTKPTSPGKPVNVNGSITFNCTTGGTQVTQSTSRTCNETTNQCTTTTTTNQSITSPSCSIGASGGGSSGSSRVICTHFFRKGMLRQDVWRADMTFTFQNLSPVTVKGYHLWAIPYVKLMRKSSLAEKLMFPLALWRAEELAYQMGVLQKGNFKGKVVRWIGEPLCFTMGIFSKQGNWSTLWENEIPHEQKISA